ncbi:hypothetical protein DERF_009519 [Dermatophagoides farinae]|uniref:Uncharacterized protein n=1 Tax=Dermatophagoides farinae TaxID=6954 RepID=A0A922HX33_DERFA|nr:hypothetical protein DERF_009519 [Dermatophagoides farinae]
MISRRRILSRSRDELMNGQYPDNYNPYEEEEDVWYSKDKLLKLAKTFSISRSNFISYPKGGGGGGGAAKYQSKCVGVS